MSYSSDLDEWKRLYWTHLLLVTGGRVRRMSEISGVNRTDVYKKLKKYGLTPRRMQNRGNAAWQALGEKVNG